MCVLLCTPLVIRNSNTSHDNSNSPFLPTFPAKSETTVDHRMCMPFSHDTLSFSFQVLSGRLRVLLVGITHSKDPTAATTICLVSASTFMHSNTSFTFREISPHMAHPSTTEAVCTIERKMGQPRTLPREHATLRWQALVKCLIVP